jgi:hypothetical protein
MILDSTGGIEAVTCRFEGTKGTKKTSALGAGRRS